MEPAVSRSHDETQTFIAAWSNDEIQHPPTVTNISETLTSSFPTPCSMENLQEPVFYSFKVDDPVSSSPVTSGTSSTAMWLPSPVGRGRDRPTCSWSKKEVLTLLTHWANPAVQQELKRNVRNNAVYNSFSAKLASLGFYKTSQKCKEKLKKLKQDYRRIKNSNHLDGGNNIWFDIIDQVLGSQPAASKCSGKAKLSSAEATQPVVLDANAESKWTFNQTPSDEYPSVTNSLEACSVPDPTPCPTEISKESDIYLIKLGDSDVPSTRIEASSSDLLTSDMWSPSHLGRKKYVHTCSWSKKEVHALLAYWANPSIQQELQRNVRNNAVYNSLSAKLASLGFNKSAQKCKEKIKKLKQDYRRIKKSQHMGWSRTAWFGILDEVLCSQSAASKCLETPKSSSAESTKHDVMDVDTNDEWLPDEVQVLITLWAQPNIQKQLLTPGSNSDVFTYLSNELALVGFIKTPQQCSFKVKKLIEEYNKTKDVKPHRSDGSDWFAIMDGVLSPDGETSKDLNSSAVTAPKSPEDSSPAVWTSDEVDVLLTQWAEESVQERLTAAQEDERVYAQLSSELATQGFDKTTNQCRTKVKLLKEEYERIRKQKHSKTQNSSWFAIMDKVYGCSKLKTGTKLAAEVTESEMEFVQESQHDPPEPVEGCHLSISSLCLLVPTLRLMCAFAWQVVRCCNVVHYRKVEELVVLVTELAPELLTARERVQLLLRLRARLALELCRSESTATLLNIQPHLEIIQDLKMSSSCDQEDFEELEKSKTNFLEVVHTLIEDTEERKRFFMEVFPIHYGQPYDATLQTLVWKFISRLDSLLPIPDIKQTAEWLSSAPSVLEECGQLVLEREQLKALLNFQQQTGNKCFPQVQNMFLPMLSLHPKTYSKQHVSRQQEVSPANDNGWFGSSKEPCEETEPSVEDSGEKSDDLKDKQRFKPYQLHHCSMCSYSVSQVSALLRHIRQHHLIQDPSPFDESEDDFLGSIAAPIKETTNSSEHSSEFLKDVASPNSQGPPFQCDKCDKKYLSKSSLIVHNRIHTGETPFLCSICGQGFRSSSYLELHTRIHTGERRFKCHICGKTSIQHLTRHMRMHRGEKNYLCTECGKAFLSSGELKLHTRYHTGERPYTCKHCGKGFIAKCLLTVHTRRHTGESPYRCSLCPKSFPTLRAQKKHLKIHTDKKSFQCLKCGKIFRQEDTFKLHVETHELIVL